jgi:hypothetical protein
MQWLLFCYASAGCSACCLLTFTFACTQRWEDEKRIRKFSQKTWKERCAYRKQALMERQVDAVMQQITEPHFNVLAKKMKLNAQSCQGHGCFSLHHHVQSGSGAHPGCWPMGSGVLSSGVRRQGREVNPFLPSSAEVKNAWSYTSIPPYVFMAWCILKHRDNFRLTSTKQLPFWKKCFPVTIWTKIRSKDFAGI